MLLGASTQSLGTVMVGAWLGGALGVSVVTNDPAAAFVGSAAGIAAVILAAEASNEVQIYVTYATVTALLTRVATSRD